MVVERGRARAERSRAHGRGRIAAAGALAVLASAGTSCLLTTDLDGLAGETPEGRASSDSSAGGVEGATSLDAKTLEGSSGPGGPGEIYCASTTKVCDVRAAECCVTLFARSTAASRSYTASSAACAPVGSPCGQLVVSNDSITMEFSQLCASAQECGSGQACCVLPFGASRFGKEVSSIACLAASDCATKGRALCRGASDCAPGENCVDETDPVLSHIYTRFCE